MNRNRLERHFKQHSSTPKALLNACSFVLYPVPCTAPFSLQYCQAIVYQAAWRETEAIQRPSLPERDLLGVWN
jgi:hypothetical protein